ncbi:MAG: indole-3-glycerol-phosphate synthase [Candidatus Methanomethylicia archaeon]
MPDFLDILVRDARRTVESGYYEDMHMETAKRRLSLKESIEKNKYTPIIAEVKPFSPSLGVLRRISNIKDIVKAMERGGAVGISILTEPIHFKGSLKNLEEACSYTNIPVLMKDIVVDPIQIEAASKNGADAILLIYSIFRRGYVNYRVEDMIDYAHSMKLEVLLETHSIDEFKAAVEINTDLIGINNRDLTTLKVDLNITRKILENMNPHGKIIISESGIEKPEDIRFLYSYGVRAFLIGSAIMLAENIENKIKEFVYAYGKSKD